MAVIDLLNLEATTYVKSLKGQKIMIYGDNNLGKTRQSMNFNKPLLLMTESGGTALNGHKVGIDSWSTFNSVVSQLTGKHKNKMQEKFETVIIDTIEELVFLNEQSIATQYSVNDVGEMSAIKGAPNGYSMSRSRFKVLINTLTLAGYCVVFLSHMETIEKTNPKTGKVENYVIPYGSNNVKSSMNYIRNLCDFVFYVSSNGIDEKGHPIMSSCYTQATNHAFARSRYIGMVPYIEEFTADNIKEAIFNAIESEAENQNGEVTTEFKSQKVSRDEERESLIKMLQPAYATLYKADPEFTMDVVAQYLGTGVRISEATNNDISSLHAIYDTFMETINSRKLEIDEE